MSSRSLSRLVNSSIENFIARQNAETSYRFPISEPHPRLEPADPAVTAPAPFVRCSDCKCKRPLVHFEGRRCWYLTCIRCRNSGTQQRSPPPEAMINWDELDEFYSQFRHNPSLPINMHLPSNLVDMPVGEIMRRFIVHFFDVSGFEFYLKLIHDPSRRSAIAFYASCRNSSDFPQQIPGKCGNAGYA
ncbi:hypothetical protein DM01DRAFT_1336741 [Hesseltinella vesiculosa]|uniref:Uncharacterized protein n=1 Tax=Hesseltinella vesiculosa TaxID=101127 RepID=A0A1X2GF45_9FUNG|nr:hypothetical protein DM01DRAFT_1336741 [Hesseltinella vesiculosa]